MIKVEVIEKFTLKKFGELKNIKRSNKENEVAGKLFVGDTFDCSEEMAKYLTGDNAFKKAVVKVVEVQPEEKELPEKQYEETKKEKKKKTSKK